MREKRHRPTLTEVRQLENTIHTQCEELRGWRSEYLSLCKQMKNVRDANKSLNKINDQLRNELKTLKSRGFWARVFNRK